MAEYRNELLERWIGSKVLTSMLSPPSWGENPEEVDETSDKMVEDPGYSRIQILHSTEGFYLLEGYDRIGVTIRKTGDEGSGSIFVPWGSIIRLWGKPDKQERDGDDDAQTS